MSIRNVFHATRATMRRLALAALLAAGAWVGSAPAQVYPARPITLVVPIAAGGAVDTAARIFAEKLQESLQQPVMVENRTGAGAMIGTGYVAKAAPDGYTLLLMESSVVLSKWLHKTVPFDITSDFTPIARIVTNPLVLFANASVPANGIKELIAYAKASPGKLSVGTSGIGTPHHLAVLMLNTAAGIDITHVPYRGTAPALADLLSGQIPLMWSTPVGVMQFVDEGKLKTLGVTTPRRVAMLPQVPTLAENAVPGFDLQAWLGIAGPAGLAPALVARLSHAIFEITELPDVQKRMAAAGQNLDFRTGVEYRERLASDHEKFGAIIRAAGIAPN
jgi:tripartite-type tricarboxylate transporter receptor subunit TctC